LVFRGEVRRKPGCGLRMRMRMADMCWAMGLPLFAIEDRELLLWARAPGGGGDRFSPTARGVQVPLLLLLLFCRVPIPPGGLSCVTLTSLVKHL
jgi:hypothetical protein